MQTIEDDRVAAGGAGEDVRVLRRLEVREGFTGEGVDEGASVCAVVDIETTGLDLEADSMIQFAMRRFRFDADGVITRIGACHSFMEDPGRPIPPEISRLTGISDADVAGRTFPDAAIERALRNVTIVVAHNAAFDRKWIERRFPGAAGLAWACSMEDVPWQRRGFDGRKLGFLGVQCGFFYEAHRADVDVDAVVALLGHRFADDGRTALDVMMENARADTWLVSAVGAAFDVKDRLRARGYRWNADGKVWAKEVRDWELVAEEFWLAAHIYSAEAGPRCLEPRIERRTRWERYA
jgi:DNA polymerase III subunit epsilon